LLEQHEDEPSIRPARKVFNNFLRNGLIGVEMLHDTEPVMECELFLNGVGLADGRGLRVVTVFSGLDVCEVHRACAHFEVSASSLEQLAWKSVGKSGYYAQGVDLSHTKHIRVDFGPKEFRY
jgi:hypothetical protein